MVSPKNTAKPGSTSTISRDWPVFRSFKNYVPGNLGADLAAGLTLAAIAIPEQMATARLGGFSPETGFVAFIAGSLGFAALGANRFLSAGADSTITPIFAGGLGLLAVAGTAPYGNLAAMLALLTGVILVGGGVFRLGWIADLLSVPVTTGFLAGIAAHIVISQLPALLGLAAPSGSLVHHLAMIARGLGSANPYTLALGLGVLLVTFGAARISPRLPGAFVGLAAAAVCTRVFHLDAHGVAVLGAVPNGLPRLAFPTISLDQILHILPLALMVSMVVMVQTAATARSFTMGPDDPVDVNRDFLGLGAGSVLAGFLGAFPVNASPPRTSIVAATGARSQLAGLTAAAIVLLLAGFGMNLLRDVPYAGLAGILIFVANHLVRVPAITDIYRQTTGEFILVLVTMAAIIVLPIEIGVATGIILSLVHGMWTTTRAGTIELERVRGTTIWWPPAPGHEGERLPGVCVVAFQGPLSFLNAYEFKRGVTAAVDSHADALALVVLEASSIAAIDYTAATILGGLIRRHQAQGIRVAVARLESLRARAAFERFGIVTLLGEDRIFRSVDEAVQTLSRH